MPGWVIGSSTSFVGEAWVGGYDADQSISASDSGTLSESPEIALAHAEAGALGETPAIALGQDDAGGMGEGQELALAILDTGTLAESPAIALDAADSGTGSEGPGIALGNEDSGTLTESGVAAPGDQLLDVSDTGTLAEAGSVVVAVVESTALATPNFGGSGTRYPTQPIPRTVRAARGYEFVEFGESVRIERKFIPLPDEEEDEMLILSALALV